jgi:hypothetical protein
MKEPDDIGCCKVMARKQHVTTDFMAMDMHTAEVMAGDNILYYVCPKAIYVASMN